MEIPGGYLYLEKNAQTYVFLDRPHNHPGEAAPEILKGHAFKTSFIGCNTNISFVEEKATSFYYNYYLGNNPAKWKSKVHSYKKITYKNLYNGIDYVIGEDNGDLKSDYYLRPGADASQIKLVYQGADGLSVKDGKLIIKTSLAEITENVPYAYQVVNGVKKQVDCEYVLDQNKVGFKLGIYNKNLELVIDPVLFFSTYIGATADNFGCTATYDKHQNAYGGALVFPGGVYPATLGAFQSAFAGSDFTTRDMGITKFDSTGTSLIFSTYIGGTNGTEVPHSLVVDESDNLFVFGTTGSTTYPTTTGAYDVSFNGGSLVSETSQGLQYNLGSDIVISKFNPAGTALLGSTYLGGSNNDGLNYTPQLNYNYGDILRGEIIVDPLGNPIICSTTFSMNYPVTPGAPQPSISGPSDAVVTKLNSNLTGLLWSTYFGGNGSEAGFGMQPDMSGNLFFTGGTTSANLPVTAGVYDNTFNGIVDGFLAKINNTGTTLMASTYIGTNKYDQSYLIQVDSHNDVYVFGQTTGAYPVTPGKYFIPNSGQFIHKLSNNLTTSLWSTTVGRFGIAGNSQVDISPTAFLLNKCDKIYICGWGGTVNHFGQADFSSTSGLPITPDAFQSSTDGSDFYLAIFSRDMTAIEYGTFFGGAVSAEHVDGGTARFDKNGVVYQAVCAGCGGHDDFPTTPGAWSNTNNSSNCNLAVFKFNLDIAVTSAFEVPITVGCGLPYVVSFTNTSTNSNAFIWAFGDGDSSTVLSPTHSYTVPGDYTVTLIGYDTMGCYPSDTFELPVRVPEPFTLDQPLNDSICKGSSTSPITITGGLPGCTYAWTPTTGVAPPTGMTVTLSPTVSTNYRVIATSTDGCKDTVQFNVHVFQEPTADFTLTFDTCNIPAHFTFTYTGLHAGTFFWDFGDGFTSTLANPLHTYADPGNYTITLTVQDPNGCGFTDAISKNVFIPPPLVITLTGDEQICLGSSSSLNVSGGLTYQWSPATGLSNPSIANPIATPGTNTTYTVISTDINGCKDTASIPITVIQPPVAAFTPLFTPCYIPNNVVLTNNSTNSSAFIWQLDGITVNSTDLEHIFNTPGDYEIVLIAVDTSDCGFSDTATYNLFLPPPAQATAWGTDTVCIGLSLQLFSSGGESYTWLPPLDFLNPNVQNPYVFPPGDGTYYVIVTDTNNCTDTASVPVFTFPITTIDAGNDLVYDFGQGPAFNPSVPNSGTYTWTPSTGLSCTNCLTPEATPEVTTTYYLHYTDQYGCVYSDSLIVMVTPSVYIPNAFTPNGDGMNEFFIPIIRNLKTFNIDIFDRWGELIYTNGDMNPMWDGTYHGIKVKDDVYVWKIKYTSELDPSEVREKTGHVTVLR